MKALGLETMKHPNPYKIGWIEKGSEVKVHSMCKIPFSIGKFYQDKVTYDVVEMDACQLLLERLWQFDVCAYHKGRQNVHVFIWKGRRLLSYLVVAKMRRMVRN